MTTHGMAPRAPDTQAHDIAHAKMNDHMPHQIWMQRMLPSRLPGYVTSYVTMCAHLYGRVYDYSCGYTWLT